MGKINVSAALTSSWTREQNQDHCDKMNMQKLNYDFLGRYYFTVLVDKDDDTWDFTYLERPVGTKSWLEDNPQRTKGLIRKIVGNRQNLVDDIYDWAVATA